jgi:hypothetical protein
MRVSFAALVAVVMAVAIAACGSSPSASSTPGTTLAPGATATSPGATLPPTAAPTGAPTTGPTGGATAPPGSGLTGHECDAIPTFSLSNPNLASPAPDATLNAHFPAQIDGQPVTDVQSQRWIDFLCVFGGQAMVNQSAGDIGSGLNLTTMSFGSAKATVDGESVDLNAFRTPSADATTLVQSLALIVAQTGNAGALQGTATTANIGGKNVYVWTDSDGAKSYAYASGDTLITFNSVTDSQATKILTALP